MDDIGGSPPQTAEVSMAPVDDVNKNNNVTVLFSQLQPPTPTKLPRPSNAHSPQGSPTPQLRRSKTQKHNGSSCAGMTINPDAAIGMDLDNSEDYNNNSAADLLQDIKHETGASVVDGKLFGSVDGGNEMTADVENNPPGSTTPKKPPSISMGETIAAVASGEPLPDNVKPGAVFDYPQLLHDLVMQLFLSSGMNAASLARKTKSEAFTAKDNAPWGDAKSVLFKRKEVPISKRGRFYCKHKTDGTDGMHECSWNVAWSYYSKKGFVILDGDNSSSYPTNFCLEHNHPVATICRGIDNCFIVSKREDLEVAEIEFIHNAAQVHCSIPQVQLGLRNKFGKNNNRTYGPILVKNQLNHARDQIFGKDRHKMKELMEHGNRTIKNGGVFEVDVSSTLVLEGVRYQSSMMRQMAIQFGGYFFTIDGTYGTNSAKLTTNPVITADSCGLSHCCGVAITQSENSTDAIKALNAFKLSSLLEGCEEHNFNDIVDGVTVNNHVLMNSCRGSMFTDAGPFSFRTAKKSGKDHCLCTQHERQNIFPATAGLGNTRKQAINDMSGLIFKHTSVNELDEKFDECKLKYRDSPPALKFLNSLERNKKLLCRAHTQVFFSYNHTTTQRGEGYNDRLKGHGTLKKVLSDASLPALIDRVDAIALDTNHKSIDILTKVRTANERVTPAYKEEVEASLKLSALTVTSCEHVDGSEFVSTRTTGEQFNVDLKTKIMHRGVIFVIPTCNCGYYLSCFRLCRDIVKALVGVLSVQRQVSLSDLLVPQHIHPFHLVQLHPLWPQALRKANREDYSDMDEIGKVLQRGGVAAAGASSNVVAYSHGAPCPEKFYVHKANKKVPSSHKARHTKLNERVRRLLELAVNKGNVRTYDHCYARLLQTEKELLDMIQEETGGVLNVDQIVPLPPQECASNKAERLKADSTNNSRLSVSATSTSAGVGGRKKKATGKKATGGTKKASKAGQKNQTKPNCVQCELMKEHMTLPLSSDHEVRECPYDDIFLKHFLKSGTAANIKIDEA